MGTVRWGLLAAVLLAGCGKAAVPVAQCPDPVQGCRVTGGGVAAEVRFASSPGALKPFVIEVAAPGAKAVAATFAMMGMDMGENRYQLVRSDAGPWRAEVILPVCVAGRADWLMTLEIDGRRLAVPFVTAGRA